MIEALAIMLGVNAIAFAGGFIFGRLTAPPTCVTADHHGDDLPARFRAAEGQQFDLRPSAQVIQLHPKGAA